jgi:hypothetical protein
MILSSDELGILAYLKSWKGSSISMVEICRSAGGRQRYREEPNWANSLLARLVEEKFVEVNDRGHYCYIGVEEIQEVTGKEADYKEPPPPARRGSLVGDDYFPSQGNPEPESETEYYVSPQIREILMKSGKKFGQ